MSRHLPLLQAKFPGKILLSADDIARCLEWSKGHVYNLSYTKKLPFPLVEGKGGVQVSIIALADYLDSTLSPKPQSAKEHTPVPNLIKPRRRGRPRGSISKRQMAFQSALSLAIVSYELEVNFTYLAAAIEDVSLSDGPDSCSEKFDRSKVEIEGLVTKTRRALYASVLDLKLQPITTHKTSVTYKI